jgi:pimeloyl-ACP methyl ester carboxylesterase
VIAMPTIGANGLDIHLEIEGQGPPLFLLHGATSASPIDWSVEMPVLARRFRVHMPDARGHGGTRWSDPEGISVDTLVDDVVALGDVLGLGTFHLAGFSLGAVTALRAASRFRGRFASLVLAGVDTEPEPRASVARALFDPQRIERDEPAWAIDLEQRHGPVQGPGAWRRLCVALAREVGSEPHLGPADLRAIAVPTLVLSGDRDPFTSASHQVNLYRQLPDARLLIVPGTGHLVLRSAGIVTTAIGEFYASIGVPDPAGAGAAGVSRR